jgi:ribosomal protein S14
MATTAKIAREEKKLKFGVRHRHRCRELALRGDVAGVVKSSW